MKRIKVILTAFIVVIAAMASAQETVKIKEGQTLLYKINEYDGPVDQTVTLTSLASPMKISWNKKNKYDDKGTFLILKAALESAINIIFSFPINSNDDELSDVLPGFIVSKKMYNDIKSNKNKNSCWMRIKADDMTLKSEQPMYIIINGKKTIVNTLNVTWGTFGDEMWILDNPDYPIIVKVSAISKYELTEIK
ncbi:MAG: hypothetical protein IPH89_03260 [Bacteroidetes bacterium]|nr:hypothetical protein [Bacteroidota bacterium]